MARLETLTMTIDDAGGPHRALREDEMDIDPLVELRLWIDQALAAGIAEPTAAALATATRDGCPSVRIVLARPVEDEITFYTHYESRKARELDENPRAALAYHWPPLGRQVRLEGSVERATAAASDAYFDARPVPSRLSAWASPQSHAIPDRAFLERRVRELASRYRHARIPRPTFWGGYRLRPHVVEFWQSGPHRLHDRLRYAAATNGGWRIERLAP